MKQDKNKAGMPGTKAFERAELEFIRFALTDVITTSNPTGENGSEDLFDIFGNYIEGEM